MTNRYLVTGCAGFIGSKVSELLLLAGHTVVGIDNLNDAYDPRLKQWRLDQLLALPGFHFVRLDIADRPALEQHFEKEARNDGVSVETAPYAAVINLAARAGVRASVEQPQLYYQTNCDGTLHLLEMCRKFDIPKFVLASSSSLYGENNPTPYREDANTDRPLSPYAASKKAAETLAHAYHYLHGLDVSILRYFTVYGPAGRPDMSIFRFIQRISEDRPIMVFGDGGQQRDFTYVEDIARGTIAALRPLGYEIINLGAGRPLMLNTVIQQIADQVGSPARIDRRPADPVDVSQTWADTSKAKRLLDWEPQIAFEEGLRRAVAWHREHHELATSIRGI